MKPEEIVFMDALGLQVWMHDGGPSMSQAHRHQDLEVNYLLAGEMQYLIGGTFVALPRNRFCVLWGAMPHQAVSNTQGRKMIWATLPLAQVMLWNLPGEFLRQLLGHGISIDPQPNEGDVCMLQQWQRDLESDNVARRQLVTDEIGGRLQRMAVNVMETDAASHDLLRGDAPSGEALALAGKMAELVGAKFREPLSVAQIARHVNLHPGYAMTLFRQQTGMTLNLYLTRQRVAHAQRLLATSTLPILEIAAESGFCSVSRFYEAFKTQSGCTPRQFRQRIKP